MFALEDKFRKVGIDPDLIAAALDADEPSIDALCLHLLELLIARDKLPKDGPKHIEKRRNAISDTIPRLSACCRADNARRFGSSHFEAEEV